MTTEEKFNYIAAWVHFGSKAEALLSELRQEMAETVKSHQKMNANYEQSADENEELCALIAEAKLVSANDPNSDFGIAVVKAEALAEYTKVCKKRNEELGEIRRLREALQKIAGLDSSFDRAPLGEAVEIARTALAAPGAPTPDSALGDGLAGVVPNRHIDAGEDAEPQV